MPKPTDPKFYQEHNNTVMAAPLVCEGCASSNMEVLPDPPRPAPKKPKPTTNYVCRHCGLIQTRPNQ